MDPNWKSKMKIMHYLDAFFNLPYLHQMKYFIKLGYLISWSLEKKNSLDTGAVFIEFSEYVNNSGMVY